MKISNLVKIRDKFEEWKRKFKNPYMCNLAIYLGKSAIKCKIDIITEIWIRSRVIFLARMLEE